MMYELLRRVRWDLGNVSPLLKNIFVLQFLFNAHVNSNSNLQAFATVCRDGLCCKLLKSGINGKCFACIQNMYKDIKSKLGADGISSKYFNYNDGLRQGENLSPFLFS